MANEFRLIRQIDRNPPTFVQDHLTWKLMPVHDSTIPFYVTRNDGIDPTDEDYAQVQESMSFLIAPQYGPLQ